MDRASGASLLVIVLLLPLVLDSVSSIKVVFVDLLVRLNGTACYSDAALSAEHASHGDRAPLLQLQLGLRTPPDNAPTRSSTSRSASTFTSMSISMKGKNAVDATGG